MKLFTSIDYDFINKAFGRNATKEELKLLYTMLQPVLVQRELFQDKYVTQIEPVQRVDYYQIESEYMEIDHSGHTKLSSYLYRKSVFNGFMPSQLEFVWMFAPPKSYLKKISNVEESKFRDIGCVINHHIPGDAKKKKSGYLVGYALSDQKIYQKSIYLDHTIGYLSLPKLGKTLKHEKNIYDVLNAEPRFIWGMMIDGTLGDTFRRLFNNLPKSLSIKLAMPKSIKKGDGMIITEGRGHLDLKKHFNALGYDFSVIGKVKQHQYHEIDTGNGRTKKWSLGFQKLSQTDHQIIVDDRINSNHKNKAKALSHLSIVKKMLGTSEHFRVAIDTDESHQNKNKIKTLVSRLQTIDFERDLFFSGVRSIADVIRVSSTLGIASKNIQINSNISDKRYLSGQNQAIGAFGLTKNSHYHFSDKIEIDLNQIISFGDSVRLDKREHSSGDFISLLGALKGELSGSFYAKLTGQTFDDSKDTYDLAMEHNINQALIQAVSNNVIKTVQTISKGGLALALCNLYLKLGHRMGLKVHVSRNLSEPELLFGESYGAAIITIGERELMEFQRICISHGIPCSTIGRLHDTPEVTVNDIIKINGKAIESI